MIIVTGHRGAAGVVAENTLKGFRRAIELGVDAVECDVHLTRDGQVVVMHDDTVDRTTGGTGRIAEMDLADVRRLDAGDGEPVPTLDELLETVQGRCELLCELKADGVEAPAADAVLARGMAEQVMFISFSLPRLAGLKRRRDALRVGVVLAMPAAELPAALELPVEHVGIYYKQLSPAVVEQGRAAGVEVGVWTPNTLGEMQAMIALGVDRITTDRPDILLDHLNRGGAGRAQA